MQNVYSYTDYRKFLHDWYAGRKEQNPSFSYRIISARVGFRSAGHFTLILQGKANISLQLAMKFAAVMRLKRRETDYFQNMVLYNQAKSHAERKVYFEKMQEFKESAVHLVDAGQYEYYGKWYHAAIRALAGACDIKDDYAELGAQLIPSVPAAEVVKSVELLLRLNLVRRDESGILRITDQLISTGYDIQSVALTNYLLSSLNQASKAFDRFPRDQRNMSCVVLGISHEGFLQVQQELRDFRRRIMDIAKRRAADSVYQLSFQFFPLSKPVRKENRGGA